MSPPHFAVLQSPNTELPARGKTTPCFFAVNQYKSPNFPTLQNPIDDAKNIAEILRTIYGFDTKVVENPTYDVIENTLKEYSRNFASGRFDTEGELLIFFSGHGARQLTNGYFLPSDARPDDLKRSAFNYKIWRDDIDAMPCKHILVAIDACYSGTFDPKFGMRGDGLFGTRSGELSDGQRLIAEHDKHKTRLFFTSGETDQPTPDKSDFAKKFKAALLTNGYDDGILTSSEMFSNHLEKAAPRPRTGEFGSDEAGASFVFVAETTQNTEGVSTLTLERQEWDKAKSLGSKYAYEDFKRRFPNSDFVILANTELKRLEQFDEDRAWIQAKNEDTEDSYKNFISYYPFSVYRDIALKRITELKAIISNTNIIQNTSQNLMPAIMALRTAIANKEKGDNVEKIIDNAFSEIMNALRNSNNSKNFKVVIKEMPTILTNLRDYTYLFVDSKDYENAYKSIKCDLDIRKQLKSIGQDGSYNKIDDYYQALYLTGLVAVSADKEKESVDVYKELVVTKSDSAFVYSSLYKVTKDIAYLELGLKRHPNDAQLVFAQINYYLAKGELNILINKLKSAMDLEPNNVSLSFTLGSVYDNLASKETDPGQKENYLTESLKYYQRTLEINPKSEDALYSIAANYYNRAANYSKEMKKLDSDFSKEGQQKYDKFERLMMSEFETGLPYFQKAEALSPNDLNILVALKEIYTRKKDVKMSQEFNTRYENTKSGGKNSPYFRY